MNKNTFTQLPNSGDILVIDNAGKKGFIIFSSFDKGLLNTSYEIVGIVALRQGNTIFIVNKNNSLKKWAEIMRFNISGWILDGQPHVTTIKFHSSQQTPTSPNLSYNATTIEEVVTQLNTWADSYYTESGLRYYAYKKDDTSIYFQKEPYSEWYEYVLTMTDLSVSQDTGMGIDANINTYAYNGDGGEYKGINWTRYYQIIHDSTSSMFNPTTPITSLGTYPLSYTSYANEIGAFARNIYSEGEEGYKKYLHDYMIKFPSHRGILALKYHSGKENTYTLCNDAYLSFDGSNKFCYPAFKYCSDIEYNSDGLRKGDWYLPSIYEITKIWQTLTYGTGITIEKSDPINRALNAIGGDLISVASNFWSACRYSSNLAWNFLSYGCSNYYNFYNQYYAVPFALLELNECEIL